MNNNEQIKNNLFEIEDLLSYQDLLLTTIMDLCRYYSENSNEALKMQLPLKECAKNLKIIQEKYTSQIMQDILKILKII